MTINNSHTETIKSGVVALVGPPNVGKSTLLNALMGQKISIVSPKPQTTRNRILGILNDPGYQIILMDTPGLHTAHSPLNLEMVKIAMDSLSEVDVILFMIDATFPLPKKTSTSPTRFLEKVTKPAILLINKIDKLEKGLLLPLLTTYKEIYPFTSMLPVSALHNDGTGLIIDELLKILPEGPRLYPEDIPTDSTERFIVAEIIREKIFLLTGQEIPYSTAVTIDMFQEEESRNLVTIDATIYVEKKSQKGIVIGKGGSKLKQIGKAAREDIEILLASKVMLKLWVKVQKDWTKDPRFLKELGF
ncbi:MAG: GTPase Era [Proteobacteria bacterium]|nr:GTPase Era [Pseudomonadota bacterium]MBU1710220.1 GTPase Era [Pseudomonadota bacterium]